MMPEFVKCVILSHKRAKKVESLKAISNCIICVPESQKEEYEKYNPGVELLIHPDSIVGLSAKIRWTYEQIPNIIMIDDDISNVIRMYQPAGGDLPAKMTADEAYNQIQSCAYTAKQLGCKFFGFGKDPNPFAYLGHKPFELTGFVIGGSIGFFEGFEMNLPDECIAACDYYLSAINAYYHRMTFVDRRFIFTSKEGTFKSKGGMADFRTLETEKLDYLLLRKHFGEAIQPKGKNPVRGLQHSFERTLKIPF